jgi:purine-binding chemotaxis protein CheW
MEPAMTVDPSSSQQSQYLTFMVGDVEYGVGILRAKEIIEYVPITRVPNAPEFVRGVINLRGRVVAVVDLAVRFGRVSAEVTRRSCIVIVELERDGVRDVIGVIADRVMQVAELPPDAIEPVPAFGTGVRTDWLLGLGRAENGFVLLLDTDRVLTEWDAVAQAESTAETTAAEMAVA